MTDPEPHGHHPLTGSTNGSSGDSDHDLLQIKRRSSTNTTTGLNPGINPYNGIPNHDGLYWTWAQSGSYGPVEAVEAVGVGHPSHHHPHSHHPAHYEATTLYTPPTLGMLSVCKLVINF